MTQIIDKSKRIIAILVLGAFSLVQVVPVFAVEGDAATGAQGASVAQEASTGQSATTEPAPPQQPSTQPTVNNAVSSENSPTPASGVTPVEDQTHTGATGNQAQEGQQALGVGETQEQAAQKAVEREKRKQEEAARDQARRDAYIASQQNAPQPTIVSGAGAGSSHGDNVGNTSVTTENANNTANVATNANSNLAVADGSQGSASVVNDNNGAGSNNNGSANTTNNNTTNQGNSAYVTNNLNQRSETGSVTASDNRGNTEIKTGEANTTGTVITAVNTNVDGVMVAEFNVADSHVGDLVLDFGNACISGCGTGTSTVANTNNGQDSTNTASSNTTNNNTTNQVNDAGIVSNLNLSADSGNNKANDNVGDTEIETKDANVAANVLTFANNNLAGNVIYGVVNIFGKLVGDIIFPEDYLASCTSCGSNTTVQNTNNGQGSTNTANQTLNNNGSTFQANDAVIENNLSFDANTGDNTTNDNYGDSNVKTGEATVDAKVLNVANSNISGGDWWIVLVNEAGNWVGRIMGAPEGAHYAGSEGSDFSVDENGIITATNDGNGQNSTNTANSTTTNNDTTVQSNTAKVQNNLNLSANTGGNDAKDNRGNSSIKTGNANIVANLVNFVNNNISGGRVFVTVVNVFDEWLGDFVSPGQKKEKTAQQASPQPTAQSTTNNSNGRGSSVATSVSSDTKKATKKDEAEIVSQEDNESEYSIAYGNNNYPQQQIITMPNNEQKENAKTLVKNAVLGSSDEQVLNNKIKINLAWLVVLIPAAALFFLGRKVVTASLLRTK